MSRKRCATPCEVDEFVKKQKTNTNTIKSQLTLEAALRGYKFKADGKFAEPNELEAAAVYHLVDELSLPLAQCAQLVPVRKEASLYPYVFEVLKVLCRLSTSSHVTPTTRSRLVDDDDKEQLMDEMIRSAEQAAEESTEVSDEESEGLVDLTELLKSWEKCYEKLREENALDTMEFSVLDTVKKSYKLLVQCNYQLCAATAVIEFEGFWQAAADLCTAHSTNCARVYEKALLVEKAKGRTLAEQFFATAQGKPIKRKAAQIQATERAEKNAAEQAFWKAWDEPVYLALTDFKQWVFLRVQSGEIVASRMYSAISFIGGLRASPDLYGVLRYLALGADVHGTRDELMARAAARLLEERRNADQLVAGAASNIVIEIHGYIGGAGGDDAVARANYLREHTHPDAAVTWDYAIGAARALQTGAVQSKKKTAAALDGQLWELKGRQLSDCAAHSTAADLSNC